MFKCSLKILTNLKKRARSASLPNWDRQKNEHEEDPLFLIKVPEQQQNHEYHIQGRRRYHPLHHFQIPTLPGRNIGVM